MQGRHVALSILLFGASFGGGIAWERHYISAPTGAADQGPKIAYWVAPMDPNFRRDGPGKSPMGMDLIPVYEGDEPSGDPAEVEVSAREINAIGVRTALARVEDVARRIETVGFVGYDEHRTSHIHVRAEGWIEDLKVRAVGDRVAEGDLLFRIFSPDVTVGSAELVRAVERGNRVEIANARRKLESLGVSDRQIDEMARTRETARSLAVYAPQGGVVTALEAADGMFLQPATRAMSIADLGSVWLMADVFERDIGRLAPHATAEARFEHLPGRVFEGTIDYIYPELDRSTRTLPVRLRFDNADGLLRPNMYATVSLAPDSGREAVTVPSEAVIRTGRAERVILKVGDGRFRPRLVTTGLTDGYGEGGRTEIVQGLKPGEEVVASAQFLIDSESAMNGALMRMAPTEAEPAAGAGVLVALDADSRSAEVRHEAIPSLDWPAMTTRFTVRADVPLADLTTGEEVRFAAARGADGTLALTELAASDGVEATGTGVVERVEPDGKLLLAHDPVPALAWPAMTMALPTRDIDTASVPVGTRVEFDLARAGGGLYAIVAVRPEGAAAAPSAAAEAPGMRTMAAEGSVNSVDAAARTANITHGPLAEIGMPGMTMDFPLAAGLDPAAVVPGPAAFEITVDGSGRMVLTGVTAAAPPIRVQGTINRVDAAARTANVTHGPMADIGMPGMTMDFALADGLDPAKLPIGREVPLLMRREADFTLTLLGLADKDDEVALR
ncbi:efflux RND transporter periplasmic adaptor subunit [Acuticoccus sediminis]|uniref:Efflux RND transporter periplasmic adaptor subunit n=1 Tax=Acuticoccus sediminis TaxID=2184697 RepID=A0A8B2NVR6_9HYPH|nr:efflux RND transporter periplasmic adaptor subunit [Acuticoccus sediminis]RAI01614.1 efflux RND transporter periplasmic adaptor subunit [Acuticoccus sediminis]